MAHLNSLVEKYLSDDLSEQQRIDFEEHLFECPICSEQVRQDFTLIENLKAISPHELPAKVSGSVRLNGWRDWFRIPSLVPTFAALALACVLAYQNLGGGPGEIAQLSTVALLNPVTKSAASVASIRVDKHSPVFRFDVNTETIAPGLIAAEVDNFAGHKILTIPNPVQNAGSQLQVTLPAKDFPPGRYQLVLRSVAEPDSIVTYPFSVDETK